MQTAVQHLETQKALSGLLSALMMMTKTALVFFIGMKMIKELMSLNGLVL